MPRRPRPASWISISGAPVHVDGHGRIDRGGPHRWRGVHIRDIALLERKRRKITHLDCHREVTSELRRRRIRSTFKTIYEAVGIVKRLNAEWFDSFDPATAIDVALAFGDAAGHRKLRREHLHDDRRRALGGGGLTSWNKVLAAIMPRSKRWADVPARLAELHAEVARSTDGHIPPLMVPEGIYELTEVEAIWRDCEGAKEKQFALLLDRARGRGLRGRRKVFDLSDVPF